MKTRKLNLDDFAAIISEEEVLTNNQMNVLRGGDGDTDPDDPKIYIKK